MIVKSNRWWIYSTLLAFSASASVWVTVRDHAETESTTSIAARRTILPVRTSTASAPQTLALPANRFPEISIVDGIRDPFAATVKKQEAFIPPPPPPVKRTEVATSPSAPPLPFTYRGVLTDSDGTWLVQLGEGNDYLLAGPGEIIDSIYRLDALSEDELRFTYLPLSTVQILTLPQSPP